MVSTVATTAVAFFVLLLSGRMGVFQCASITAPGYPRFVTSRFVNVLKNVRVSFGKLPHSNLAAEFTLGMKIKIGSQFLKFTQLLT